MIYCYIICCIVSFQSLRLHSNKYLFFIDIITKMHLGDIRVVRCHASCCTLIPLLQYYYYYYGNRWNPPTQAPFRRSYPLGQLQTPSDWSQSDSAAASNAEVHSSSGRHRRRLGDSFSSRSNSSLLARLKQKLHVTMNAWQCPARWSPVTVWQMPKVWDKMRKFSLPRQRGGEEANSVTVKRRVIETSSTGFGQG